MIDMFATLLLAGSIASDGMWTFMHHPLRGFTYKPSVASANTFGSPDHMNGSLRVTEETLAAAEAAFEALYERAWYSSEGRTNGWDEAEYGPTNPCPEVVTNSVRSLFAYQSWEGTNRVNALPGTRRLVDFQNIFDFYDQAYLYGVQLNYAGNTLFDRAEWWDSNSRQVFFACSETPGEELPTPCNDWTLDGPSPIAFGRCFYPLFNAASPPSMVRGTPYEYRFPNMEDLVSYKFALSFMFDDAEAMMAVNDYQGSGAYTLDDVFGYAIGCTTGLVYDVVYDPHTRRLVPDEYVDVDIGVEREYMDSIFVPCSEISRGTIREWKPWIGCKLRQGSSSYGYGYAVLPYEGLWIDLRSLSGTLDLDFKSVWYIYGPVEEYPDTLPESFEIDLAIAKEAGADFALLHDAASAMFTVNLNSEMVVTAGEWHDLDNLGVSADLYREVCVTKSITTNVSVLATIGREMAVMDRTYEVVSFADSYSLDASDTNTYLNVINTSVTGVGGRLVGVDRSVYGVLHVDQYGPPAVLSFVPNSFNAQLPPPSIKTKEMQMTVTVVTNGITDTKKDRIRFHGTNLAQSTWDIEGSAIYSVYGNGDLDYESIEFPDLPDGLYDADMATYHDGTVSGFVLLFHGIILGSCSVDLGELDNITLELPMHTVMFVDGRYSMDRTEPMTIEKAERLYAFAGPSDLAFGTLRVRDGKFRSFGGLGYFEDFSIYPNGTMKDRDVHADLPYLPNVVAKPLSYKDLDEDMERERTHYKTSSEISEHSHPDSVTSYLYADRIEARSVAFGAAAGRAGCDLDNPSDVLDFTHAAEPKETNLSLSTAEYLEVYSRPTFDSFLVDIKGHAIVSVLGVRPIDQVHTVTQEVSTIGMAALVSVDAWDVIDGISHPPELKPSANRDPAHADADVGRIVWTDWDWKALKLETED